jgi:hypothetical protein
MRVDRQTGGRDKANRRVSRLYLKGSYICPINRSQNYIQEKKNESQSVLAAICFRAWGFLLCTRIRKRGYCFIEKTVKPQEAGACYMKKSCGTFSLNIFVLLTAKGVRICITLKEIYAL